MKHKKIVIIGLICTFGLCGETETINAAEAAKHIGEYKTVCGKVVSTFYHKKGKSKQTYLNIDKAYPNQIFTILIWGSDRKYFDGAPEEVYRDKDVCVDGKISSYKGNPQIMVKTPTSIRVLNK